jgi:hypothetical protein
MRSRIVIAVLSVALVLAVAIPIAMGASGERVKTLTAAMNGKKEVDANGKKNSGDLNGLGGFTAVVDKGQLCFGITVRGLDAPVAAHIHRGGTKVMGPVVLPLTQPTDGDPGASSGCVAVEDSLATELLRRPSRFYVNVHTGPFPNGAVRGQLKTAR